MSRQAPRTLEILLSHHPVRMQCECPPVPPTALAQPKRAGRIAIQLPIQLQS